MPTFFHPFIQHWKKNNYWALLKSKQAAAHKPRRVNDTEPWLLARLQENDEGAALGAEVIKRHVKGGDRHPSADEI